MRPPITARDINLAGTYHYRHATREAHEGTRVIPFVYNLFAVYSWRRITNDDIALEHIAFQQPSVSAETQY